MKLGLQAAIYYSTATRAVWGGTTTLGITPGPVPGTLVRVGGVKDVSMELEKTEVETSTRDSLGYETVVGALRKGPVNFKVNYDPADPGQLALLQAFLQNGVTVPIAVLDSTATPGGAPAVLAEGLWMGAEVLKFSKGEVLQGVQEFDVTIKASGYDPIPPQWVKVTAS